ncbi:gamma-glutamyltransferase family protein [Rhodococcus sp. CH91]|uniref:gamma-glutamyltransferase family protein n=1 Tax=Rhodococcus sp. CH91 TaxID=2910256 RepID=UPI001F4BA4A7|nr:gamma-glutamyltransferase [Rhodococcus sp. CH91]
MRRRTTRPATLATGGMVASSHPLASQAGARVLAEGGNAVDAALTMAAITWLTLPGQCGIGGDAFAVVREPDGSVWTVNGSGYGPDGGTPGFYRDRGLGAIPLDGALAVTVPGAPAALAELHRHGASRPLPDLWAPAVRIAERGLPCSAKTRTDVQTALQAIRTDAGLASVFAPGGRLPRVGEVLAQPDLARTIRSLAHDPHAFYTGTLAERCVDALQEGGAPFSGDEWQAGASVEAEAALTGTYSGHTVHQTPLPTPGWMVLHQAALCDGTLRTHPVLGAAAIDRMARAAGLAFEDRLRWCASDNDGVTRVLDDTNIAAGHARITERAPVGTFAVAGGDTTSFVAVDADGRAVSFIHSLAFTFGAKLTVPGTGIVLNNRLGRGAYLIEGHPNEIAPRRKPLHTLNAWIVTDAAGELRHVGNTPGGDGQVQWNMQLLSHLLDHGLDPQEAVSAPRFTVFPGSDANVLGEPTVLRIEADVAEGVPHALTELGHRVEVLEPLSADGSAQVISLDEDGVLRGGSDPRQEGIALGV